MSDDNETKKVINIRLEEKVWRQAKMSAAREGMTLQNWLTHAILKTSSEDASKE